MLNRMGDLYRQKAHLIHLLYIYIRWFEVIHTLCIHIRCDFFILILSNTPLLSSFIKKEIASSYLFSLSLSLSNLHIHIITASAEEEA